MLKKLVGFLVVVLLAGIFWFAFALWTGIYSVYSIPPTHDDPEGATYIVSREEGEPMFNSPQYVPPVRNVEPQTGIVRFSRVTKPKRPIQDRTIVQLPYIAWAFEKSVEKPDSTQ
ncbi:MAG TPA: hypothetical protein VMG09_12275 [Bacteroidota bacterium]|nr:hypothetical protein [Bacteroidota bacterium]